MTGCNDSDFSTAGKVCTGDTWYRPRDMWSVVEMSGPCVDIDPCEGSVESVERAVS